MRPKGKLFALLAVFAAIGLITASGAFTTVTAERTANIETSGDSNALLALEANQTSPNGNYVADDDLTITFQNESAGLNRNATSTFDHMFNVTNNGEQAVTVTITDDAESTNLGTEDSFVIYQGGDTTSSLESGGVTLAPGESLSVGIQVDTTNLDDPSTTSFDVTITVTAEA